jgi:hypothetical protein
MPPRLTLSAAEQLVAQRRHRIVFAVRDPLLHRNQCVVGIPPSGIPRLYFLGRREGGASFTAFAGGNGGKGGDAVLVGNGGNGGNPGSGGALGLSGAGGAAGLLFGLPGFNG